MPIGQLRPRVVRQIDQHGLTPSCATAGQVELIVTHHHHVRRLHIPRLGQLQQASRIGFRRRFVATEHVVHRKAVRDADGFQCHVSKLPGITGQDAQTITPPCQLPHQLDSPRRRFGLNRHRALVLQQPGMFGRCDVGRQRSEMPEDVVFLRDIQRPFNGRKIMGGDSQRAVHVEYPVAYLFKAHDQSLRWRIKPS